MSEVAYSTEDFFIDNKIEDVLGKTEAVNKREDFISMAKSGDVLLTSNIPADIRKKNMIGKAFVKSLTIVQRSPFSSIKLVVSPSKLIGYGLSSRPHTPFAYYSFPVFLRKTFKAVLLRTNAATEEDKQKVVSWALERKDIVYGGDQLVKTFFNRLLRESIIQIPIDGGNNEITQAEAQDWRNPLICSSIIAMAYKSAGLNLDLGRKSLFNVWPRDFLLSKDFYPVCQIDINQR